jgi:hypothetical protein
MDPRVAICIPSLQTVPTTFALALAQLARQTRLPILLFNVQGSLLPMARDQCIDAAKKAENSKRWDYFFFLDSDVLVPGDAVMRLVAHDKDVVGASYAQRTGGPPMVGTFDNKMLDPNARGLLEVLRLPTGCLLIKRHVFDKLKKPYFRLHADEATGTTRGEDVFFCETVRALGFKIWLDTDLTKEVGHLATIIHSGRPQLDKSS